MSGRAEHDRHAENETRTGDAEERTTEQAAGEPEGDLAAEQHPDAEERAADAEARVSGAAAPTDPLRDEEIADDEATALAAEHGSKELAALLLAAQRERDTYLDHLRRERAEFENFRKRATRERMEALDRGAENLAARLLDVLDDFDRVLDAAKGSEDPQLLKGVEMVNGALHGALREAGLEEVPGDGAPFDPNHHEAMMQVEAEEGTEGPVVAQVLRRGYQFKGRVLRPASVSVAQ